MKDNVTGRTLPPKRFSGKTEAEVRRKMREFQNDPMNQLREAASEADAARYFRHWTGQYKRLSLKASSYDRLDSVLRNYIEPQLTGIRLRDVTEDDCRRIINSAINCGKAFNTVKKIYDALHGCFDYAVDRRDVPYNPLKLFPMPVEENFVNRSDEDDDEKHLTREEKARLLAELYRCTLSTDLPVYRYRDAFTVLLNTGLRVGELVALDWKDVDFVKKIIHVRKTAVLVRVRDKGGKPTGRMEQIIQKRPRREKREQYPSTKQQKKPFSV